MNDYDAVIVGGGPAGTAAAITLARGGARVVVLEEKHMPRDKLCGEFVTPECLPSLKRLGVLDQLSSAGAQKIQRFRLVVSNRQSLEASLSEISGDGANAIGLSRSRFDQILFESAKNAGATCLEGVAVKKLLDGQTGVEALSLVTGKEMRFRAPITIDASGRQSRLMLRRSERVAGTRGARRYAMKVHLEGVEGIDDQIELFFFDGGYGGLSRVEGGLHNLCFIVSERILRNAGGEPLRILDESVKTNEVARERLQKASPVGRWLTVGPLRFGALRAGAVNLIAIGDASGMIDPFTGTGIQMALRTGELAARSIATSSGTEAALATYRQFYREEFGTRLYAAGVLRRIAFSQAGRELAIRFLSKFPSIARRVLRATRAGGSIT